MNVVQSRGLDVVCAPSVGNKFQSNLGKRYWTTERNTERNIIKYLKITRETWSWSVMEKRELSVQGYIDANFQTELDNLKL